tara:strand:- start:132 stop:800 length:669 start_codon:yes stop_codon:yes gene_type:complete
MVKQVDVFWKAAIFTLIVFLLGVSLGYFMEGNRIKNIRDEYKQVEVEWADAKLLNSYFQTLNPFLCDASVKENLEFADRVYEEGLKLEKYEKSNKLNGRLLVDKQRYALLKVEFWLNSILIKNKCSVKYVNLIYFYKDNADGKERVEQETQSVILKELKDKYGSNLMLIPLPLDLNISMINVMKNAHGISKSPSLLINEKIKLEGVYSLEKLDRIIRIENGL